VGRKVKEIFKGGQMKVQYLPWFNDSVGIETYLEVADEFFKRLPNVCPFCGWIGDNPLHHGYTDDWQCPIYVLAMHIRQLRGARYLDENLFQE
jgi:hypothetical protein